MYKGVVMKRIMPRVPRPPTGGVSREDPLGRAGGVWEDSRKRNDTVRCRDV